MDYLMISNHLLILSCYISLQHLWMSYMAFNLSMSFQCLVVRSFLPPALSLFRHFLFSLNRLFFQLDRLKFMLHNLNSLSYSTLIMERITIGAINITILVGLTLIVDTEEIIVVNTPIAVISRGFATLRFLALIFLAKSVALQAMKPLNASITLTLTFLGRFLLQNLQQCVHIIPPSLPHLGFWILGLHLTSLMTLTTFLHQHRTLEMTKFTSVMVKVSLYTILVILFCILLMFILS